MAFILSDRVKETTITTGTADVVLGGTFGGFTTFALAIGNNNSTFYGIETSDGNYEVGVGTYTSADNTLSRDTVLSSSNSGSKITLTGVSTVFVTQPGSKAVFITPEGYASGIPASYAGVAFPDGTIQATSATDGAAPATMRRNNAGVFFHYYVDNTNDRTVALHLEDEISPQWRLGVKDSPASTTAAPSYGYVFGENGSAGAFADANNAMYINTNNGFWVQHESATVFNVDKSDGSIFKDGKASTPTLTVRGAAAQSANLQQWQDSAETIVAKVSNVGSISGTSFQFPDGTTQTTASTLSAGDNVSLLTNDAGYIVVHPTISAGDSADNSDYTFIQDLTLDSNGHVIGLTSASGGAFTSWKLNDDSSGPFIVYDGRTIKFAGGTNVSTSYDNTYGILTITSTDTTYTASNGVSLDGTVFSAPNIAIASGALRADITTNSTDLVTASGALRGDITTNATDIATASGALASDLHAVSGVGGLMITQSGTLSDMIALKSNIASPTFTGTPAAPTAAALTNTTQLATTSFVRTEVTNLIASAPSALDTLNELAEALGDDEAFSTTVTNSIATKASSTDLTTASGALANDLYVVSGSPHGLIYQASGGGGGSMTTVKANGSQVGGADIVTLDFSSQFSVAETPDTEINVSIGTLNQSTTGSAATLTTSRNFTVGSTDHGFNGSANVDLTAAVRLEAAASGYAISGTLGDMIAAKHDTIDSSNRLNANLVHDGTISNTEFGWLNNVSSNIQTQLDAKLASSSYTAADVLSKLLTVDGAGTSLDADKLDGQQGSYYLDYDNFVIDSAQIPITKLASSGVTIAGSGVFLGKSITADEIVAQVSADAISGDQVTGGTIGSVTISQLAGAMDCNSQAMTNANIDTGDIASAVTVNKSPVITLGGDLTGNCTLSTLGNATLTATIADEKIDSDNYVDGSIDEAHLNVTNGPTDNYLLSYTAGGPGFTWVEAAGGGSMSNVVEDTTPQLGGTLDANSQIIDMGTYTITDAKVGQWDTAYGWGDHGSAGYISATLTEEQVEDFVGGMLGGTETGITVTYQDSTHDIDFVVADTTVDGDSGSTGITPGDTLTIAGGTNVTTAMAGDTLTVTATDTTYSVGDGGLTTNDFTNDDHSKLNAIEALADVTDSTNVVAALTAGTNVTISAGGTIASTDTNTTYTKASFDLDHLFTLVDAAADTSEHLGTFTGSTISDSVTIKAALQALETAVETKGVTAGSSSIVTVGTIATGIWEATDVAVAHGGTGASTAANARTNLGITYANIGTVDISSNTNLAAGTGITLTGDTLSTTDGDIVHDSLSGFVENEHLDWTASVGTIHAGNYTDTVYTLPSASVTVVGGVELATTGETTTGTDTARAVTPAGVQAAIDALIGGAPGALDTLNELAAAINDDASYAGTITTALGTKAPIASPTFTGTVAIPNVANLETAVVANTAKVTNATHTGDVTGSTALTIATDAVDIAMLSATGTASSSTFLRGDNSWVTPTDTNTMGSGFTVSATTDTTATTITQGDDLFFAAGTGITCATTADGTVTISSTVTDTNTTYTGGTNLTLSGTTFNVDDAFLKNDASDTTTGTITAGGFTTTGTWTFDESTSSTVGITTVQKAASSFSDNDTSLMTSAAIADKIEAYSYSTTAGTVTSVATAGTVNGITLTGGAITSTGTITLGGTLANITFSQLHADAIQTSGESFTDNDTSLMTSAAIDDRINTAVASEDTLVELNDTNISSPAAGHLIIYDNTASVWDNATLTAGSNISITNGDGAITIAATDTTYAKADFDLDHLFTLVGAAADTSEHLGTFTGSTISDNQTIKASIQALETAVETKGVIAGSSSILTVGTIGTGTWAATDVAVAHGGTGASSAGDARTNLELGSAATRAAEDTLTDGANLPDGAAIKAYGDTNWAGGAGDITSVVAGAGLTDGGTTGDVTLNIGEGTGIDVAADAISVDVSDFMTNGANNYVLTATGTDAMNAEANFTFDGSAATIIGTLTVGVNGTGHDVKFFGDTTGSYLLWDEDEDRLHLVGGAYVNQPVPATGTTTEDATVTLDLSLGNYFNVLLGADVSAVEFTNATIGQRFIVRFVQVIGATDGYSISWSTVRIDGSTAAELKWAGSVTPTMTGIDDQTHRGHKDVYGFLCTATGGSANDTKFDGFIIGQDIPD
jgi:hypothetical protein